MIINEGQMSTFKSLSQLITVNDICEPFIGTFDSSQHIKEIREKWSMELSLENNIHPMDQIALVSSDKKIIGWLGYDMLNKPTLTECIAPVNEGILLSSDTPLIEAIKTVCNSEDPIFLVLKGNKFIGYLNFNHFNKLPFRISLFALLLDLESTMLNLIKSDASFYLKKLSDNRLEKAKNIYGHRKYKLDGNNEVFPSLLVDCTTLIDKFLMLRKNADFVKHCPGINNRYAKVAEETRNLIAHPENEEIGLLPIKKEELLPLIEWVEEFHVQLKNFASL